MLAFCFSTCRPMIGHIEVIDLPNGVKIHQAGPFNRSISIDYAMNNEAAEPTQELLKPVCFGISYHLNFLLIIWLINNYGSGVC